MSMVLGDFLLSQKNPSTKVVIKDLEENVICTTFMSSASSLSVDLRKRTINQWFIVSTRLIYIYLDDEEHPEIVPVTGVGLSEETLEIEQDEVVTLVATVIPENATDKTIAWMSTNESVATVSEDGVVTGGTPGNTTIIVTTIDGGFTATCVVEVKENPQIISVTSVTVEPTTLEVNVGDEPQTLQAIIEPEDATNKNVIWSSSNEECATVSEEGIVTIISEGIVIITATTEDGGFSASCEITISIPVINVTGVTLSEHEIEMALGSEPISLIAIVTPEDATDKSVTWQSNDENIVTVSEEGIITPIGEGTTTVTVTTVDGDYTDECSITISPEI